jgi:agmatine deiminase
LKAVDFNFNCYGNCQPGSDEARKKEGIDREIAKLAGVPVIRSELVTEGGAHDFNGRGVMIANETLELGRNPNMTRDQIEVELKRVLGQKKVIWLKQGIAEDDAPRNGPLFGDIYPTGDTGGHVDEFCRFVDSRTILLAAVTPAERDADPVMKINYDRMEENYKILQRATDQDGRHFRIIRVPVADIISEKLTINASDVDALKFFHGSQPGKTITTLLAASYLNFFISNGVVLISKYWKPGRPRSTKQKDEAVRRLMQRLFPDRKIVQIDAENLNYGGGGMHCATQEQPTPARIRQERVRSNHIRFFPFFGGGFIIKL